MITLTPLHEGLVRGRRLRFFRTPLEDGRPDWPWHSVDDLHRCLRFPADQRAFFLHELRRGPFGDCVRTIATAGGPVTLAPHFVAVGTVQAAADSQAEDEYSRAAVVACQTLRRASGVPPTGIFDWIALAHNRWK